MISFEAIFEQSTPNSPIVFILSPGSDPASDLMKLAERSGFGGNRLKFLAMGQGQEKVTSGFHVSCGQECWGGGEEVGLKPRDTGDGLAVVSSPPVTTGLHFRAPPPRHHGPVRVSGLSFLACGSWGFFWWPFGGCLSHAMLPASSL